MKTIRKPQLLRKPEMSVIRENLNEQNQRISNWIKKYLNFVR